MSGTQMHGSATDDMPSETACFAGPMQPVLCCCKQLLSALLTLRLLDWACIIGEPRKIVQVPDSGSFRSLVDSN